MKDGSAYHDASVEAATDAQPLPSLKSYDSVILGAVLGNIIARGETDHLATIIGAAAGTILARKIDRKNVRCR